VILPVTVAAAEAVSDWLSLADPFYELIWVAAPRNWLSLDELFCEPISVAAYVSESVVAASVVL